MQQFGINLDSFESVMLSIPIDWNMDPFKRKNWRHKLNSLEWLKGKSNEFVENIITNFHDFHISRGIYNQYFNSRAGDHTACIRLNFLSKLSIDNADNLSSTCLKQIIDIIEHDVKSLMSENIYRPGHNHGLMADVALLKLDKSIEFRDLIDSTIVIKRGYNTISKMFHANGLTTEHSISYQLWNLKFTLDFLQISPPLSLFESDELKNKMMNLTKKLVGFAHIKDSEIFPFGDSFRHINHYQLKTIFSDGDSSNLIANCKELLAPFSSMEGTYTNQEFGFIRKNSDRVGIVHLGMTSGCNSSIHKQDDELSFCLAIDGRIIIDDAGYSDVASKENIEFLKSQDAHSGIRLMDHNWLPPEECADGSSMIETLPNNSAFSIKGSHSRIQGFIVKRGISISDSSIKIINSIERVDNCIIGVIRLRFILGEGIVARIDDKARLIHLLDEQKSTIARISYPNEVTRCCTFSDGIRVKFNRTETSVLCGIDIYLEDTEKFKVQIHFD